MTNITRTIQAVVTFANKQDVADIIGGPDAPFNLEDETRYHTIRDIICADTVEAREMREDYGIRTHSREVTLFVEEGNYPKPDKYYLEDKKGRLVPIDSCPYLVSCIKLEERAVA